MSSKKTTTTTTKSFMPLVFLFVFVDILGFSIVLPLFPYWRDVFGASTTAVGVLASANAIAQLLAGKHC
jgi:DHA1 family tetracycline resistance protein-like MFS transporter